ncbi:hypothetical protein IWW36_001714 [Coemansia brasiliensis]|uniref:Uncharacterized protein n=1 Tax=Coemansia brasiliensis TaxID=2650707 RepID=A0A9W8LYU1_9FUNG|nr:hypothetical protein IWW36_001714 [Coemansia brasiliensis]
MALQKPPQNKQLTKKPKVAVLEEDEFRATIDQIIERDFFPDIRKLRVEKRELVGSSIEADDLPEPASKQSLDGFLSTHTSEDNASFSKLLAAENKRRQERISSKRRLTMGGNPGCSRNALMFMPDGIAKPPVANDKQIIYQNTRFSETDVDIDDLESVISEATTAGYKTPEINGYRMVDLPTGFSIAPRTPRELAGLRLASPSAKRKGAKPPSKSASRADMLSPAAQRLLGRSQKYKSSADNSIRSAYNSPYVRR